MNHGIKRDDTLLHHATFELRHETLDLMKSSPLLQKTIEI